MSICRSGLDNRVEACSVLIGLDETHPLIGLAQSLPWRELFDLILPDLKKTKTGRWWLGRKLKVRIHLGVYFLQQIFNKTDREIEYDVKDNAAYQIFCGRNIVDRWHAPDHTKIEKFRSRLSEETQKILANKVAAHAVKLGFADCSDVDVDSTVQEAHMAYPADSCLLKKLGGMANKVGKFLNRTLNATIIEPMNINIKKINSKAREYFFLPKISTKEMKNEKLMSLLDVVREETRRVIEVCESLSEEVIEKMTWNYAKTVRQIKQFSRQYIDDVKTFLETGFIVPTKILSFHLQKVACFTKGKLGKKHQFGRHFQLGRTTGNFFFVTKCDSVQMPDKKSLTSVLDEHQSIFDNAEISSVSTDKGYYSKKNETLLIQRGVKEIGIQRPHNIKESKQKLSEERKEELINRRSGIEPLIGHIKQGGQLGRSRMKSDKGIEASGYTAVLGFNMRQLIRYQKVLNKDKAA